jgi:TolB protein
MGLGGFGVLVCIVVVAGAGLFLQQLARVPIAEGAGSLIAKAPTSTQPTQSANATVTLAPATITVTQTTASSLNDTLVAVSAPTFGQICFKSVVAEGEPPGECRNNHPPVVEIHALFDYAGMSSQREWTRIWYHNGAEVLKVKEYWTGDTVGQFDYNLNTADGHLLSSGLWQLELYVDGQLKTFGSFIIEEPITLPPPVVVTATPEPTPVITSEITTSYRLAFTKWDGSKHSIWVANLDGTEARFLLDFAASPSLSPDGQNITFFGEEGIDTQAVVGVGTNGVWRMTTNGESPMQLIADGSTHSVAWSPVEDLIAFDGARGSPDRRVFFIDANGIEQSFETLGDQPSWSPDAQWVVVKLCRPECGLWIINRDNTDARQLTGEGSDGLPAWSPDGLKIAFSRNVADNVDIFVIDVDGTNLQRLTTAPGNDSVPAWTPDSRHIVFRTTRNDRWQIFLMNADGSDQRQIIDNVGASDEWAFDRMSIISKN